MNKKILVIIGTFLVLSIAFTPFALAKPWDNPKNNEKFQSFSATFFGLNPDYETVYKPNEENANVVVQSWGNNLLTYEIIVGENHYLLHEDFEYDQKCVHTSIGAPFIEMWGLLIGSKSNHMRIECTFDFSAGSSEISGTLSMFSISNNDETSVRSLRGTGDLKNVQILATAPGLGTLEGIVTGWPE